MSKSAIKYLTAANEILAALDLTIGNPASWMTNDTTAARSIGLTNYDYALREQDYAC